MKRALSLSVLNALSLELAAGMSPTGTKNDGWNVHRFGPFNACFEVH